MLYVQSFAAIFYGPRAALPADGIVDIFAHGKPGVAHIYGMKSVTVGSVAYAASMVGRVGLGACSLRLTLWQTFYGISSARSLNKCPQAMQLYRQIHRNFDLDDSTSKEINEDLLTYWNRCFQLFLARRRVPTDLSTSLFFPSCMVDDDDEDDFGFLADIQEYNQAQREAQARAHQEHADLVVPA